MSLRSRSILKCVVLFAPLHVLSIPAAHAVGVLKFETDGFLRTAEDRANSTQTLSVGPRAKNESAYLASEVDLQANVQLGDRSTFTPEARNLYLATSSQISPEHQVSFGRRTEDWSEMDDRWELGVYSPRFIWDPTRPQKIGLTGALYQLRTETVVASVFGSCIDVPERGFPIREENGKLSSSSRFYVPVYEYAEFQGSLIPIRYNINYPPMEELLINPGGVARVRVQQSETRGAWVQASGGYMPIHQPYLAIEDSQLYSAPNNQINIQVHPSVQYHRLMTLESGYKANRFALWGSVTQEDPERRHQRPNTVAAQMEKAIIAAVGGEAMITRSAKLNASFLHIDEEDSPPASRDQVIQVDLQGRFTYKRAVRAGLEIESGDRMSYGARWIYDLAGESHLASLDTYINLLKTSRDLTLNLGTDFFISSTGTGTIGQYKGNDRVRGGISYVF